MSIILNVINYFWKLGFHEKRNDVYVKRYGDHRIEIDMANETIDYGIAPLDPALARFSQRNFVVMESIDRLMVRGVRTEDLRLGGAAGDYCVSVKGTWVPIRCELWEDVFIHGLVPARRGASRDACLYCSRLKAGIIECWMDGAPEVLSRFGYEVVSPEVEDDTEGELVVRGGVLVAYRGTGERVTVPRGVARLGNGVFWHRRELRTVDLPEGLSSLGGDTFYGCTQLENVTIPSSVEVIGDNPFAGCPRLRLACLSPHFRLENGLLLNHHGTRLIYCAIDGGETRQEIPNGVISVGKHAFYACKRLREIVIPPSVKILENNPFSDLPELRLKNRSPHFRFLDGALYNNTMGTLFYYEASRSEDVLEVPEGVRTIGRHSFFNCRRLTRLVLPSTVTTIGYNPFAGCSSVRIETHSPDYIVQDGVLYTRAMDELISYPAWRTDRAFCVPSTVRKIGRSAFFANGNLQRVVLSERLTVIDRSAFAYCSRLSDVVLPSSVQSVGEWAFEGCRTEGRTR